MIINIDYIPKMGELRLCANNNSKILNRYHVIILGQNIMMGTSILTLPQKLSTMGYSQALMPLLFGIIASISLWQIIWLCSKFPNDNLFRINEVLLGKSFGKIINLFLIIQFIVFSAGIISDYMHLIQSSALQEQTITLPVICFLLILVYIVIGGIKSIARFSMFAFFSSIALFYFLHWAIEKGNVSHFFPLFNFNTKEFLTAFKEGYLSILGYELIMFYFPYIINQKKAFRDSLIGIWISIFLFFFTTAISIMYYSEWQLKNVEFSVLNLFKAGELSFVERIDIIGVTMWVFLILSTVSAYVWCAKKGLDSLLVKRSKFKLIYIAVIIFCIIKLPLSKEIQTKLIMASNYIGYIVLLWPVFLGIIYLLRRNHIKKIKDNSIRS